MLACDPSISITPRLGIMPVQISLPDRGLAVREIFVTGVTGGGAGAAGAVCMVAATKSGNAFGDSGDAVTAGGGGKAVGAGFTITPPLAIGGRVRSGAFANGSSGMLLRT